MSDEKSTISGVGNLRLASGMWLFRCEVAALQFHTQNLIGSQTLLPVWTSDLLIIIPASYPNFMVDITTKLNELNERTGKPILCFSRRSGLFRKEITYFC